MRVAAAANSEAFPVGLAFDGDAEGFHHRD
ncbi:hypothetical protein WCLP8_5210014 [uncultured Gammaproteobacteria bacterium]